jgi:hypothetical protein
MQFGNTRKNALMYSDLQPDLRKPRTGLTNSLSLRSVWSYFAYEIVYELGNILLFRFIVSILFMFLKCIE